MNDPEEPRRRGTEVLELRGNIIVERPGRSANRCAPIARHVPCQSETGRKIPPLNILSGFADESGITDKEQARRCVLESLALDAFPHCIRIKIDGSPFPIHDGEERLPAQTIVECPSRGELPRVGRVSANVRQSLVMFRNGAVYELGRESHEVIRHAETCRLAVERVGSHGGTGIRSIPGQRCVRSKSHLMISADHAEIVITCERSAPRRAALSAGGEPAGYGHSRIMWRVEVSLDTNV